MTLSTGKQRRHNYDKCFFFYLVYREGSIKVSYVIVLKENDTLPTDEAIVTQAVNDGIDNNVFTFNINKTTVEHQSRWRFFFFNL